MASAILSTGSTQREMQSLMIQGGADFPDKPSSFSLLFAPILLQLADYYWDYVFIEIPPDAPDAIADEYLSLHDRVAPLSYIPPNTYLPRFADYVFDGSWHTFRGFASVEDPSSFFAQLDRSDECEPDLCFECIDGGPFWSFACPDRTLLDAVRVHCSRTSDVTCDLQNS